MAIPRLSPGISPLSYLTAYTPFTPSNSEQRSPPSYYRGCWHEVCRGFFWCYRHHLHTRKSFTIRKPSHSRGMAGSELPPLPNIPHCCLPQESGPCLSSNVADRPLRPAIDRRFGRPLPHQLPNLPRADLLAINLSPSGRMRYQHPFPDVIPH